MDVASAHHIEPPAPTGQQRRKKKSPRQSALLSILSSSGAQARLAAANAALSVKPLVSDSATELVVPHPKSPMVPFQSLINAAVAPSPFPEQSFCARCRKNTMHTATASFTLAPNQSFLCVLMKRTAADYAYGHPMPCKFSKRLLLHNLVSASRLASCTMSRNLPLATRRLHST